MSDLYQEIIDLYILCDELEAQSIISKFSKPQAVYFTEWAKAEMNSDRSFGIEKYYDLAIVYCNFIHKLTHERKNR